MKKQLDFPFQKRIEETDRLPTIEDKKLLKQRWDFPFEKRIETTHRLPTMEGQKIVETTVRFPTWQKNWNDGKIAYKKMPKNCWNNG